jgi:hypothetical protein
MIHIDMRMKDYFFDRQKVIDRMKKANRRAMSKIGAFIRRRARSSLRRRKKPSPPGKPPSVHSRDRVATLKNILFAYDPRSESLVVGPVKLGMGPETVPQIHEFGGVVKARQVGRSGRSRTKHKPVRVRSIRYAPRPFMGPALEAEVDAGTIPEQYKYSV